MPSKKAKKAADSINARLQLVFKSKGVVNMGYKSTVKALRSGQSKLLVIAKNCPPIRKSELEYLAMLSKSAVHHFPGNNNALGTACGKMFRASCLSIINPGDSDILTTLG